MTQASATSQVRVDGTELRQVTNTPDGEEFADWGPVQG
jgi:hypothetical protein